MPDASFITIFTFLATIIAEGFHGISSRAYNACCLLLKLPNVPPANTELDME